MRERGEGEQVLAGVVEAFGGVGEAYGGVGVASQRPAKRRRPR
jgi:hypothetical protein